MTIILLYFVYIYIYLYHSKIFTRTFYKGSIHIARENIKISLTSTRKDYVNLYTTFLIVNESLKMVINFIFF